MEIKIDSKILSKEGILIFTQRYMNSFFFTIQTDRNKYYILRLRAKSKEAEKLSTEFLQNELLDCEFIATRYKETQELREAIRIKLLSSCQEEKCK